MVAEYQENGRSNDLRSGKSGTDGKEDDMENLAGFGTFLGGLGIFFIGLGVLWFVTVYKDINTKE